MFQLIEKQLEEENHRLDMMMEQNRQQELEAEEKRKHEEAVKKQEYTKSLSDQMRLNEIGRMIHAERIEEESKMLNKAYLVMQKEEEKKLEERLKQKQEIRDNLRKANAELERHKLLQKEEERITDLRIQKFMKERHLRELHREQELALAKAAKEREIVRMRNQQQRSLDLRAVADEMNALRIQEEVERKYRDDKLKAAKKKKNQQELLKIEREKQIADLRRAAAITLARDEEDFHRVVKVQKKQFEQEMEKKQKIQEKAHMHRKDLLKQINEKERERIQMQKEKFQEGHLMIYEQQRKDLHVKEHLRKKVEDLRNKQIPEQYIKDIEYHIEAIIKNE